MQNLLFISFEGIKQGFISHAYYLSMFGICLAVNKNEEYNTYKFSMMIKYQSKCLSNVRNTLHLHKGDMQGDIH